MIRLSYYEVVFFRFLEENHPHLAGDFSFIREEADQATTRYEQLVRSGHTSYEARSVAWNEMITGLRFSPYHLILQTILPKIPEITPGKLKKEYPALYPLLEPTLSRYSEEELLTGGEILGYVKKEITPIIQLYFRNQNHGL